MEIINLIIKEKVILTIVRKFTTFCKLKAIKKDKILSFNIKLLYMRTLGNEQPGIFMKIVFLQESRIRQFLY